MGNDPGRTEPPPSGADVAGGLCAEVLTPEFFRVHWEQRPLHRRAAEHGLGANRLPEALSVDDVVALLHSSGPSLKMFRKGEPYSGDDFLLGYLEGTSLIVNQADRHNRTLYEACRVIAKLHFLHAFAVVYLTPPRSQAVRLHNDDQDVFLLQVWGRKSWTIRPAPKLLPYTEEMLGKDGPVPEGLIGEPLMEFSMEPHDVLYIPRGFLHEAATGEEPSLHITITVPTSDFCWGVHLVKHFMQNMNMQDLAEAMRRPGGAPAGDDAALDARLQEAAREWASGLSPETILDAFDQRMARTNEGQERQFMRVMESQSKQRPIVRESSRVRLMYGVTCWCEPDSEIAVFSRASDGQRMEMPIDPVVSRLFCGLGRELRQVSDLPCADPFARVCILDLLVQKGVVQIFLKGSEERTP